MTTNCTLEYLTLFSSNRPPNSIESASIQADIDSLLQEKAHLRAQLAALNKDLKRKRAILSPLRRFPAEVLGGIFGAIIPPVLDESERQQLVVLQLVCRAWRDASHLVNHLWSGIEVSPIHTAQSHKVVSTWLARSGSVARSLHWASGRGSCDTSGCCLTKRLHRPPEDCALANSVIVKLLTEGPKVDNLRLNCEHPDCFRHLVDAIQASKYDPHSQPWNSLKSVAVSFQHTGRDWLDPFHPSGRPPPLHLIPPVASLAIQLPRNGAIFSEFPLDYDAAVERADRAVIGLPSSLLCHLTALTLTCDWPGNYLLKVLQQCNNLTTLTIDFDGSPFSPSLDDTGGPGSQIQSYPVLLPHVHTLHCQKAHDLAVLKYLQLPKLLSLEIAMVSTSGDPPVEPSQFSDPIIRFAKRSGVLDSLQRLRLHCLHTTTEGLASVLYAFPVLTHLTLDRVTTDEGDLWDELLQGIEWGGSGCLQAIENLEVLQVPLRFPKETFLDFFHEQELEQQCHLTLSYTDFRSTPCSEADFDEGIRLRQGLNMSVCILRP